MSLIIETGTGNPDADAYCSVDFVKTFLPGIGIDLSEATDPDLEIGIRRGTIGIEALYAGLWPGQKSYPTQALSWPRRGLVGPPYATQPDVVPRKIQQACALAAWKEYEEPGTLLPDMDPAERIKSETIGPISLTYQDLSTGARAGINFGLLDALVGSLLIGGRKGSGNYVFFKRA